MSTWIALLGATGYALIFAGITRTPASRPWGERLSELCAEAGLDWSGGRVLGLCAGSGVATLVVVAGATGSAVVAAALALPATRAPVTLLLARRDRRRERLRAAWPDALAVLVSAVRAGVGLPDAVSALATRGPRDLAPHFAAFATSFRTSGSFAGALRELRVSIADPVIDRVAVALELAAEVGGTDLVRVLRSLGEMTRADLKTRREIQARWSWTTSAARVAAAAPAVVLGLVSLRPEAAAAYDSSSGIAVIVGGGLATALGYRLMKLASRLPEERRLAPGTETG